MRKDDGQVKEITAKELEEKLNEKEEMEIIDVREDFEVQFGMVPGATNIPLEQLLGQMNQLDKEKEYVLICRSGSRSAMAGQFMEMQGFKTVNVVDGMIGWNGPLE